MKIKMKYASNFQKKIVILLFLIETTWQEQDESLEMSILIPAQCAMDKKDLSPKTFVSSKCHSRITVTLTASVSVAR